MEKIETLKNLGHFEVRNVGTSHIALLVPHAVDTSTPWFSANENKDKAINSLYDIMEEQVWLQVGRL